MEIDTYHNDKGDASVTGGVILRNTDNTASVSVEGSVRQDRNGEVSTEVTTRTKVTF